MHKALTHPTWIKTLTTSNYCFAILDKKGKIKQISNYQIHYYSGAISELFRHGIFNTFDIPKTNNLHHLFPKNHPKYSFDLPEDIENINFDELKTPNYMTFYGKPRKDYNASKIITSLSHIVLKLYYVDENTFFAIITFPREFETIINFINNRISVVTDTNLRMLAYSKVFADKFFKTTTNNLLGQPIKNILTFSKKLPIKDDIDFNSSQLEIKDIWESEKSSFHEYFPIHKGVGTIREEKSIFWENKDDELYDFRFWKKPCPINENNFEITIIFKSNNGSIPNIIIRGNNPSGAEFPDKNGYVIGKTPAKNTLNIKRNGIRKILFEPFQIEQNNKYKLRVVKKGWSIGVFINNVFLGSWLETTPFTEESENLFGLFLRPSEEVYLEKVSFASESIANSKISHEKFEVEAWHKIKKDRQYFTVDIEQNNLLDQNLVFFSFSDITHLKKEMVNLKREKDQLKAKIDSHAKLIGESTKIADLREMINKVAETDLTVLIGGETGVGKDVAARILHQVSHRHDKPFIKIDCSTIPKNLIESELFGHEKGSFTGAIETRTGKFEQANSGTIFLDEISNLTLEVQTKLLQVLEDFQIYRIGATKAIPLDIRIITASNIPLKTMVEENQFRADLFYRINQFYIPIPPLNQRVDDIPLLSTHFFNEAKAQFNKDIHGIEEKTFELLSRAEWPGNIRQLRNAIFRAVLICNDTMLKSNHIALTSFDDVSHNTTPSSKRKWRHWKKEEIVKALELENGNITHTATRLSISRVMVYNLLKKFSITNNS